MIVMNFVYEDGKFVLLLVSLNFYFYLYFYLRIGFIIEFIIVFFIIFFMFKGLLIFKGELYVLICGVIWIF